MRPRAVFTSRTDGDLSVLQTGGALDERRRRVSPHAWTWLRQVHGSRVVRVDRAGEWAGAEADAAVTSSPACVLAIQTADCAPLLLIGEGTLGVAHVGWRGLLAGVVEETVRALRRLGGDASLRAELGPCIRARCYEFGPDDLEVVGARYGQGVRAVTAAGRPALDLAAGIGAALASVGVPRPADAGVCTACSPSHWSFRAEHASARQALVAWLEP